MVVGEGGRSTGILLYHLHQISSTTTCHVLSHCIHKPPLGLPRFLFPGSSILGILLPIYQSYIFSESEIKFIYFPLLLFLHIVNCVCWRLGAMLWSMAQLRRFTRAFTAEELDIGIRVLKNGKAPGLDDIQTELIKQFGPNTRDWKVSACLKDIRRWMLANMLKQNDEKTEFIIACPPRIRHYVQGDHLIVGDTSIAPSASARNLGVIFDAEMNLQAHIRKVCQVSYMHLRNIASIRPALTDKAAECLIHAFITSRLDCCNSLLAGLPGTTLDKLQSIQNAAARLLTGTRKYDHITPVLRELHWLPITSRIQYKVTLLVYKTLHGPAPQYLQDLIQYRSARPGLRSAGILLNVPMTRSVTYGDRAFCSIGPTWWNSLPSELKTSPSVDSFKRNLKTHLFKLAYGQ